MYCRNCGELLNDKAEICVKCGCRPLNGTKYCLKCGARTREKQAVCTKCGYGLDIESFYDTLDIDFSTTVTGKKLSSYYQKEFKKIFNSKGVYKGKFNICAFLFGPFWAMTRPCTYTQLTGLVALGLSVLTAGIAGVISCIYFGCRGNYMYYNDYISYKKLKAWDNITGKKLNM